MIDPEEYEEVIMRRIDMEIDKRAKALLAMFPKEGVIIIADEISSDSVDKIQELLDKMQEPSMIINVPRDPIGHA
jgi:hypothetical protein